MSGGRWHLERSLIGDVDRFQTSVGIAQDVADLVDQYFAREPKDKINGISGSSASQKI